MTNLREQLTAAIAEASEHVAKACAAFERAMAIAREDDTGTSRDELANAVSPIGVVIPMFPSFPGGRYGY